MRAIATCTKQSNSISSSPHQHVATPAGYTGRTPHHTSALAPPSLLRSAAAGRGLLRQSRTATATHMVGWVGGAVDCLLLEQSYACVLASYNCCWFSFSLMCSCLLRHHHPPPPLVSYNTNTANPQTAATTCPCTARLLLLSGQAPGAQRTFGRHPGWWSTACRCGKLAGPAAQQ